MKMGRAVHRSVTVGRRSAREAIMSSPVHHPEDLDAALMYAPPWARKARAPAAAPATAADPPFESPPTSPGVEYDEPPFIGDRAMLALRRRHSLDPEIVPPPPIPIDNGLPTRADRAAAMRGRVARSACSLGDHLVDAGPVGCRRRLCLPLSCLRTRREARQADARARRNGDAARAHRNAGASGASRPACRRE